MRHAVAAACLCAVGALTLLAAPTPAKNEPPPPRPEPSGPLKFRKTVLDTKFRSEGAAAADVNGDGRPDVLAGDCWYEAPDWKRHVIRKDREFDPKNYSESFGVFAGDFNGDGHADQVVIPFPGKPCYWYENPKGSAGPWREHLVWHSACNETPLYADLVGDGKRVLIMGFQPKGKDEGGNQGQMAYFTPPTAAGESWVMHQISDPAKPAPGTHRFAHGLGVGDVNNDGRNDVIVPQGWWEQPAKLDAAPWPFHAANLGESCADMHALDIDGDKLPDVLSSSAHNFGIWAHTQKPGGSAFAKKDLFPRLVSQTHALHCVDFDGDGVKDLVTGKRYWAHGPKGDAAPDWPVVLYWFAGKKSSDGTVSFTPWVADNDSGIGTQFDVTDMNGDKKLDVVVASKKGVFVIERVE